MGLPTTKNKRANKVAPMKGPAIFSPCRRYRYALWRDWQNELSGKGTAMFIGLNPSTADELQDDPTVRRCINFAKSWGYDRLCMTNIFAFRATDPKVMMAAHEPIGEKNNRYLCELASEAAIVIAAWGVHGEYRGRGREVVEMIPGVHCLRVTKGGHPQHPLYLPKSLQPQLYTLP